MNFLILGAGGIGAYFGSRLMQAGHRVTFVVQGEHGRALTQHGLCLEHPAHRYEGPVATCEITAMTPQQLAAVDVVLVCVKATATRSVAVTLAAALSSLDVNESPQVLSLQNGVDNEAELADALSAPRIFGGLTRRIGAHIVSPGHVRATGPCETIIGHWPNTERAPASPEANDRLDALASAFTAAGIPTELSDDIRTELWRKLIINNGVNPLAALLRVETSVLTGDVGLSKMVHHLMAEAAIAARADGVRLDDAAVDAMHHLISTFDSIKPSMLIDRERGRTPEIDAICGVVIDRCQRQGLDAPYTRSVATLLGWTLQ
jgi:2-dehydropantoate 2-reductase